MSTTTEFPGNCTTNTYVLHDFAEIAYIVCTHAIPASTDNMIDANSPDKILDRLRNAEKQFKQHSILVCLDTEKLELFTFYRKVDVVKDQRTILNKFGYVCRLNSCKIASKGAARVLELLKPESGRLYRLFTSAILASIQLLPRYSGSAISVGPRVHLVPIIRNDNTRFEGGQSLIPEWQLCRVNIQVVATGQLVLTVQNAKSALLAALAGSEGEEITKLPPIGSLVYLLPTGQIARFADRVSGTKAEMFERLKSMDNVGREKTKNAWAKIPAILQWLKQHSITLDENARWVQVDIAVFEDVDASASNINRGVVWKHLVWPAMLIYVFKSSTEIQRLSLENAIETDPLKFALEWYNDTAERNAQLARAQVSKENRDDTDDDHAFVDEAHFEDQYNPQTFGPPTFPISQIIYPTPPEAVITHQTPGMSSIDGLAPTPAPVLNIYQPESEPFLDEEMHDIHDEQPERVGTGFYDEDLFEEMPHDKFISNADADEPNWDFFDPPSLEPDVLPVKHEQPHGSPELQNLLFNTSINEEPMKDEDFPILHAPEQDKQSALTSNLELLHTSPGKIESVYANDLMISPATVHQFEYVGKPLMQSSDRSVGMNTEDYHQLESPSTQFNIARRRSSVFESVSLISKANNQDSRYGKHGKFWFDNEPTAKLKSVPLLHSNQGKRPASSGSDSSIASSFRSSHAGSPKNVLPANAVKRAWTEYNAESPAEQHRENDDVDYDQIEAEAQGLLAVIAEASGEDPFLVQVGPLDSTRRRPTYNTQKTLMVAQILVDQVSQSSLLRDERDLQLHQKDNHIQIDILMDHSGIKTPVHHATIADLTVSPSRASARVLVLSNRLVCVSRSECEIVARPSILPFWDILGLQPYSEAKDITAFCVHPGGSNVTEGCMSFLDRLADTYGSCSLGFHDIGSLIGLTNNGLLSWTPQASGGSNLRQVCQRLGSAIGGSSLRAKNTVVVYMVSRSKDLSCYREVCHAFTSLFEAFMDTSEVTRRDVELVLQIVPLEFVASPDTLVVPSQDQFLELALEVYNRVPVKRLDAGTASCGSAAILEEHPVWRPAFELSNIVVSPLSKDGPCLHLAYSYSSDRRWLTAAWSDERGIIAFTMSYCLNIASNGRSHSKREVFRNIWNLSNDMMNRSRKKWRLVVACTGFYDVEDSAEWQYLVSQNGEDRKSLTRLILLSIDLNPDILVESPGTTGKSSHQPPTTAQMPNMSGTPVSTPQPNTTSPDQTVVATPTQNGVSHGNAATPPEHNFESGHDMETTLVDPADQSWAVLLAYGINQSSNLLDIRPAAASGLLAKRTGSRDEGKALRLLGINLVAAPRLQPTSLSLSEREAILHEMIEHYRGLVTLAISRGCIDRWADCVPWHVATAVKGSRVLGEAM